MSQKAKALGERAEKRVRNILSSQGATMFDEKKIYPDFISDIIDNELSGVSSNEYAIEVKTTSGYGGSDRIGKFVISREEFEAYEKLSEKYKVLLILEIRPRGYSWHNYIYIVVPWENIKDRFIKTMPSQLTLSIWWAILNGHKLRDWLNYGC